MQWTISYVNRRLLSENEIINRLEIKTKIVNLPDFYNYESDIREWFRKAYPKHIFFWAINKTEQKKTMLEILYGLKNIKTNNIKYVQ